MKKYNSDEDFQDSIIRYALYKYVENEGEEILKEVEIENKHKKTNSSKKDFKKIDKIFKREKKRADRKNGKIPNVYKVAVAVAIFLVVINVSIVSVPAMRNKALDFLIKINQTNTDISLEKDKTNNKTYTKDNKYEIDYLEEYTITYLPNKFEIINSTRGTTSIENDYSDAKDGMITFSQTRDDQTISVDSEKAKKTTVDINGVEAYMTIKEDSIVIAWHRGNYFIDMSGIGVGKYEMLKVARSVKLKK